MHWLLGASAVVLLGVALGVGGRLLLLAYRTRSLPELSIGICFYASAALGYPLMLASGWAGPRVADVNVWLLGAGCLAVSCGMVFLYVFTWKVFRPRAGWAAVGVGGATLVFLTQAIGTVAAVAMAGPDASPYEVTRHWSAVQILATGLGLAWTGAESLHYHRVLRRRLALGLADPVVTNRFLLWGVFGLATTGIIAVNAVIHFGGSASLEHPASQLVTAFGGLAAGAAMYLAFLPPAAYLRFVERRGLASPPAAVFTAGG
jgi:hypothetical protein